MRLDHDIPARLRQSTCPLIGERVVGLHHWYRHEENERSEYRRPWFHHSIGRRGRSAIGVWVVGFPAGVMQDIIRRKQGSINRGRVTKRGRHQQVGHAWWGSLDGV